MHTDIKGSTPPGDGWLVIGWFTPDYWSLAHDFGRNLNCRSIPFHLFARPKVDKGWNAMQKPDVVRDAMKHYPDKTLVLMDVDCTVRGDISPLAHISSDVGLTIEARRVRLMCPPHKRVTVRGSSRVVVFRPTLGARKFAALWGELCRHDTAPDNDEAAMVSVFLSPYLGISYTHLDPHYSGRDAFGDMPDHVIVHDSAHERMFPKRSGIKEFFKRFRTGRTKAGKQRGLSA